MDWKLKLTKLKHVILSAVDPSEAPPIFLKWVALHLEANRKHVPIEEIGGAEDLAHPDAFGNAFADVRFMWEPLSDAVGRPSDHYDWKIDLTMYTNNGTPFWLAMATFPRKPLTGDLDSIARAIRLMGGNPDEDLVTVIPEVSPGKWQRWYTWKNHDEMLDLHAKKFAPTGDQRRDATMAMGNMKLVPRGSPVPAGYELLPATPSIVPREKN